MKAYLLNPPFVPRYSRSSRWAARCRGGALYYPIWLAYATSVLEASNVRVRLVDAPAWNWDLATVTEDARNFNPDVLVVESNFQSLTNDLAVAQALRNEISAISVVVGPPASQFPARIARHAGVDVVARFEYDFTLKDLATANGGQDLADIRGISYRNGEKICHTADRRPATGEELDSIPYVSRVYREKLDIRDYFLSHTLFPMIQIFTSRGCPNRCSFCSWPRTLMGTNYRARSVSNVVDEFEYVATKLPEVREIFIEDDTFTINKKRVLAICDEIRKRGIDINWSCNARADLDYDVMKALKGAGCRLLDVGFESGNDDILKNIKKGITTKQSREFRENAKKAKLIVLADFIFGLPGETKETAEQTIRFVKEIKPDIVQFAVATPIPGTEFYEWAKENDFLLIDDLEESLDENGAQKCIISYPSFTDVDIQEYVNRGLKEYYLSLSYIPIVMRNVIRKDGLNELNVVTKSALAFLKYLKEQA